MSDDSIKTQRIAFRADAETLAMVAAGRKFVRKKFKFRVNDSDFIRMCIERYVEDVMAGEVHPPTTDTSKVVMGDPKVEGAKGDSYQQTDDTVLAMVAETVPPISKKVIRGKRTTARLPRTKPADRGSALSA